MKNRILKISRNRALNISFGRILLLVFLPAGLYSQSVPVYNEYPTPSKVAVRGLLGQEILSSEKGRLAVLPSWNGGQLIRMFSEDYRSKNKTNDWYGEHAGKWLYTTTLAVNRTDDAGLKALLFQTAGELMAYQDSEGYLGSYSPGQRITAKNDSFHPTSWDVWNLTYMTLGFLELNKFFPDEKYLATAKKIGELFLKTFGEGKADIVNYGTRHGLSATIILEAAVELYNATKDPRYIDFGGHIVRRLNEGEGLQVVPQMLAKKDLEFVGDGKIYQNLWNLYALGKFHELSPNPDYLKAMELAWLGVYNHHLTPAGGPWGGIGKHKELFNVRGYFSPYGYVETCSIMSWIHFNKQMLRLTGEAKYAQEIERAAYNALLAAKYENGVDWSYHTFSNGRRHIAHFNDCCPSSGALALEELSTVAYSVRENGIACNLYTESEATLELPAAKSVRLIQTTAYPFDGKIQIALHPQKSAGFPLFVRIPDWSDKATVRVNGKPVEGAVVKAGEYCRIERVWKAKDVVDIEFPYELKVIYRSENANAPQAGKQMYNVEWFALTRGPLVYAAEGLIFGTEREEIIPLPETTPESAFKSAVQGDYGNVYELDIPGKKPLRFVPFYSAGGRKEGAWQLTWLQRKVN